MSNEQINLGIIGHGYWGPNLLRNFMQLPESKVLMVSDLDPGKLNSVKALYPGVETSIDPAAIFQNPDIHAVAIATPVSTHSKLADQALDAGKHVLVTKPFASNSRESQALIDKAKARNLVLSVDHTFVYTGAVRKIKELIDTGELGEIYYYDSTRINLGLFQHDVNVLWDLAVHDLTIMDYILPSKAIGVAATGMKHVRGEPENIAYLTVFYENHLIAHINVNWLAPVKVRQTLVGGSQKMIVYNDLEPSEKIRVYDRGVDVQNNPKNIYQLLISYRSGDMWSPNLDLTEALHREARHFIDCIHTSNPTITDGESGLRVVKILEAADISLAKNGAYTELA